MGRERGRMTTYPERQKLIMWINQAVNAGAAKYKACQIVCISIRTYQRWVNGDGVVADQRPFAKRPEPKNKLTAMEIDQIKEICLSSEFADVPPSRIVPMLADRGQYIASESSFYRILKAQSLLSHRSRAKPHSTYKKPKGFTTTQANQVWSWDISHLPSKVIGGRFYLYMIEDIYSRKIVGAEVHENETGEYASALLQRTVRVEKNANTDLVLHSDNGAPMKCFTMRAKMYELGVIPSHSRPRVSNDNPYLESLFRTLKYCPSWPKQGFETIDDARKWVAKFVYWYNNEHRHSQIKFVTPSQRHTGQDIQILNQRKKVYETKKSENPSRWSGDTRNWEHISSVSLNPEKQIKVA